MSSTILVVDDETCILKMMELVLTSAGYVVKTAVNATEALAHFGDGSGFDLVISDYKMPGMSGIDLTQALISLKPEVKVIIASGFGGIDTALEAMNKGAADFLRKPFAPDTLRNAVATTLASSAKMTPVSAVCREFTRSGKGGYNFELNEQVVDDYFGDMTCTFELAHDGDSPRYVKVVLPAVVQELIKAYIDADEVPCGRRFFQALCEHELEMHLSETGSIPVSAMIKIDDLTKRQTEWIDRMMTIAI